MKKRNCLIIASLFYSLFVVPSQCKAQSPFVFSAEGRFGFFDMTNSRESFNAVYGTGMFSFGGGIKAVHDSGFFIKASVDAMWKEGEKVYITSNGYVKTGFKTNINIIPVTISGGMHFKRDSKISPYVGGGLGFYSWSEEDDRQTNFGYHILGGLDYTLKNNLYLQGEFRWSFVPNAIGNEGMSLFLNEDDIGVVAFDVRREAFLGA